MRFFWFVTSTMRKKMPQVYLLKRILLSWVKKRKLNWLIWYEVLFIIYTKTVNFFSNNTHYKCCRKKSEKVLWSGKKFNFSIHLILVFDLASFMDVIVVQKSLPFFILFSSIKIHTSDDSHTKSYILLFSMLLLFNRFISREKTNMKVSTEEWHLYDDHIYKQKYI